MDQPTRAVGLRLSTAVNHKNRKESTREIQESQLLEYTRGSKGRASAVAPSKQAAVSRGEGFSFPAKIPLAAYTATSLGPWCQLTTLLRGKASVRNRWVGGWGGSFILKSVCFLCLILFQEERWLNHRTDALQTLKCWHCLLAACTVENILPYIGLSETRSED